MLTSSIPEFRGFS